MSKIYVASSWRNEQVTTVLAALRAAGHEVYNFRAPGEQGPPVSGRLPRGFSWSEIDPEWTEWTNNRYVHLLTTSPVAREGFEQDAAALHWCDTCVLVMPCGRSAHLEAGWAAGAGKRLAILLDERPAEPELMYLYAEGIVENLGDLVALIGEGEIDRGELEIACDDTLGAVLEIGQALRDADPAE